MTPEVKVFYLCLVGPPACPHAITFDALPQTGHATLPLLPRAVITLRPLRVRVKVPPLCRIYNFTKYEGQEIDLIE